MGKVVFAEKWNRRGDTGVFIVVVIVILIAVLFTAQKWIKSKAPDPDKVMNISPMREWELREKKPGPTAELGAQQPKITKALMYDSRLYDPNNRELRGDLKLMISPERIVQGTWSGSYYKDKKVNFEIGGTGHPIRGMVYPGKIYRDGDKEDPTKLYFLARGERFIVQVSNFDKGGVQLMTGDIYVRGWVKSDLSVEGDVILDRDDNKTEIFVWDATPLRKGFSD